MKVVRLNLEKDIWDLIIIDTDLGVRGWGEVTGSLNINGLAFAVESMKEIVIGEDPSNVENITNYLQLWEYPSKIALREYRTAISGINQALWDLFAKELNVPLKALYGCKKIDKVSLYANLNKALRNDRRPEKMAMNAKNAFELGFSFVKCTPFDEITTSMTNYEISKAMELIDAVNEFVPIDRIAIDCHQRFTRYTLSRMLNTLVNKKGIPYWVEDTVEVLDYESQKIVMNKYPEIMFAAGEDSINFKQLLITINSNAYDVIMPDVKFIGGPSIVKNVIAVSAAMGKHISLHNPNGLIATAHSAHLSTLVQNFMPMEYPFGVFENRKDFASPSENIVNGTYVFNNSPGIGIEIKEEVLKEYGLCFNNTKWIKY